MIPRLAPGQEVTPGLLNRIIEELNSARVVSADFPLERTTSGTKLSMPPRPRSFYAIIKESPERQKENDEVKDGEYEWAEAVLTNEGFGELQGSLASVYDVSSGLVYDPAYELNSDATVKAGTIVRMWPYSPVEDPERRFTRRYVFDAKVVEPRIWVKAQMNWRKQEGIPHPYVFVRQCDIWGYEEWGPYLLLWLPKAAGQMPNVVKGDVLAAGRMPSEELLPGMGPHVPADAPPEEQHISELQYICLSDYLDEQFGVVDWFSGTVDAIRPGWKLCDGTEGTPDLRYRFIVSIDPADDAGDSSEDEVGHTGGHRWHGLTENNHTNHTDVITHTAPADHVITIDDGDYVNTIGGAGPPPGPAPTTDAPSGDSCYVTWFYRLGWDPGTYTAPTVTLTHTAPDDHNLDLDHDGPYNAGKDTDNRPLFYVLAARVRIDNSE